MAGSASGGGRYDCRWQIDCWVAREEVGCLEFESDVLHRHDWEVLHPDSVGDPEAVPDDWVCAGHGAVLR
jgi:hypothetical protein